MDPAELRKVLLRWVPPALLLALVGAAVALLMTRNQAVNYQATGRVLVLGQVEASALNLSSDEIIATDAALMVQTQPLHQIIDDLHLDTTPEQLAGQISVSQEGKTELIDVTVTDVDPARAARIANGVISHFVNSAAAQSAALQQAAASQLRQQVTTVTQQVQVDQAAVASATRARSGAAAAQAQLEADNARLAQLNTQLNNLLAAQQQAGKAIDIASQASVPTSPVPNHRSTTVALGAFGGIILGVALAIVLQYLDQGLKTEEEVRRRLDLPTLGVIPVFQSARRFRRGARHQHRDLASEAYRRLRTNLLFSGVDAPLRSVVITSAHAAEGKTRTAANLAGVTAAAGERVLLVDADMRRPTQHRLFGEPLEDGMSEMLLHAMHSEVQPLNGRHQTGFENLSLLTSGTIPPNPSELLASKATSGLLRQLERQFDLVLIDTPPAQVVTDSLSLASMASGTILVIDVGRTKARQAQQMVAQLRNVDANILGVVLNKVRRRPKGAYSYYYDYATRGKQAPAQPVSAQGEPVTAWVPVGETRPSAGSGKR